MLLKIPMSNCSIINGTNSEVKIAFIFTTAAKQTNKHHYEFI